MVNHLFTSRNVDRSKIALSVNIQPNVTIDIDQAVLCGLILNELVTNALKHGFAEDLPGKITIDLIASGDNHLILSVANNGAKLPPDFEIDRRRSMGLNLVMSLVKQLKGSLSVETEPMTTFKIAFPLAI